MRNIYRFFPLNLLYFTLTFAFQLAIAENVLAGHQSQQNDCDYTVTIVQTYPVCFFGVRLQASVTGDLSDFTFSWSGDVPFISSGRDLQADQGGLFVLEVTRISTGCKVETEIEAYPPDVTSVLSTFQHNNSCGVSNGSITLEVDGYGINGHDYDFEWEKNGIWIQEFEPGLSGLGAGNYYVWVYEDGCIIYESEFVIEDQIQEVAIEEVIVFNQAQPGTPDGGIEVTAPSILGGELTFNLYEYGNDQVMESIVAFGQAEFVGLWPGVYEVEIVHNQSGCVSDKHLAILEESLAYDPISLVIPNRQGNTGSSVFVPVQVNGFENVLTAQFSVNWDPDVVTLVEVSGYGLPGMAGGNFGWTQVNSGRLSFSWDHPQGIGAYLDNGSALFVMEFQLTGQAGNSSLVQLTSTPTSIEFMNAGFNIVDFNVDPGQIDITSSVSLSGKVVTPSGLPVQGVGLNVEGDGTYTSNSQGEFSFSALTGTSLKVIPEFLNYQPGSNTSVTTLDIAITRRHILGIAQFQEPYQIIAADVNGSSTVTTSDIAMIRQVILGIENDFSGRLWEFVAASTVFADPANPFPFDKEWEIHDLQAPVDLDFTAIRLGDVNESWVPSTGGRMAAGGKVGFKLTDVQSASQQIVEVPITVSDFINVSGFQFSIDWDAEVLAFVDFIEEQEGMFYSAQYVENGILTLMWDDTQGMSTSLEDHTIIGKIKFKVKGLPGSGCQVSLSSSITSIQAFNESLQLMQVETEPAYIEVTGDKKNGFVVYQNYPNPVQDKTHIPFQLSKSEKVKIAIVNSQGIIMQTWIHEGVQGMNTFVWEREGAGMVRMENGLYFYRVEAEGKTLVRKMLLRD
jgi:hypothetical protein